MGRHRSHLYVRDVVLYLILVLKHNVLVAYWFDYRLDKVVTIAVVLASVLAFYKSMLNHCLE